MLYIRQKKIEADSRVFNSSLNLPRFLIIGDNKDKEPTELSLLKNKHKSFLYKLEHNCLIHISIDQISLLILNDKIKKIKSHNKNVGIMISNTKNIFDIISLYYKFNYPYSECIISNRLAKKLICKHKRDIQALKADFNVLNLYKDEEKIEELKSILATDFPLNIIPRT